MSRQPASGIFHTGNLSSSPIICDGVPPNEIVNSPERYRAPMKYGLFLYNILRIPWTCIYYIHPLMLKTCPMENVLYNNVSKNSFYFFYWWREHDSNMHNPSPKDGRIPITVIPRHCFFSCGPWNRTKTSIFCLQVMSLTSYH